MAHGTRAATVVRLAAGVSAVGWQRAAGCRRALAPRGATHSPSPWLAFGRHPGSCRRAASGRIASPLPAVRFARVRMQRRAAYRQATRDAVVVRAVRLRELRSMGNTEPSWFRAPHARGRCEDPPFQSEARKRQPSSPTVARTSRLRRLPSLPGRRPVSSDAQRAGGCSPAGRLPPGGGASARWLDLHARPRVLNPSAEPFACRSPNFLRSIRDRFVPLLQVLDASSLSFSHPFAELFRSTLELSNSPCSLLMLRPYAAKKGLSSCGNRHQEVRRTVD